MFYTGLMFGSRLPEGLWPYEDDDPKGGIIPRYEESLKKRGVGQHWIPDQAYENNLVGFWVALLDVRVSGQPNLRGAARGIRFPSGMRGASNVRGNCGWSLTPGSA